MALELRSIGADELDSFTRAMNNGFGKHAEDHDLEYVKTTYRPECTIAMFDGSQIVGTSSAHILQLAVEGRTLPAAGLTAVTVLPTHRRRGILTKMMAAQLEAALQREEFLMPFWVSESHIYHRFGADVAARMEHWTIDRRYTEFLSPVHRQGKVRLLDMEEAKEILPPIHRQASLLRNGGIPRDNAFVKTSFMDPEKWRDGASQWFYAVHETDDIADGYVKYRMKALKEELFIFELMANSEPVSQALWQYCFGIDLIQTINVENRPSDDPLQWQLLEPRQLKRKIQHDLWLRLVDVRAALANRPWSQEGRLVIELEDEFCPWNAGRFAVDSNAGGALVSGTTEAADIACTANELASIYLGGIPPSVLGHAGRIEELKAGALKKADEMFRSARAPWANQEF